MDKISNKMNNSNNHGISRPFCQMFLSLQVKRSAIISNKHGAYQLPHKLPNDLRPTILGN